ncbi:MAG: OmpP1/FadL family transporter [Halothiobacillus sp.]
MSTKQTVRFSAIFFSVIIGSSLSDAYATNGMDLDGYGAVAAGMGGAAMAYDNGNAGMMNNPATLGLRPDGTTAGVGLTILMPRVTATIPTPSGSTTENSAGTHYFMPNFSLIQKTGRWTDGLGVYPQGGMGSEWGDRLSGGTGLEQRSEVGFGRVLLPLAVNVTEALTLAAQLEYTWASLDLKMINPATGAYYSFSDNNAFTGQATGSGWAYSLGAHYQINPVLAVGASYHSQSHLSDLKGTGFVNSPSDPADFRVQDAQWPETFGAGVAWQATARLMLAADIKRIRWSQTLNAFRLDVNGVPVFGPNGAPQDWRDQTVYLLGGQYQLSRALILRAGYNTAKNPVPGSTLNPLAPAIVESQYTVGLGWRFLPGQRIETSVAYAPKVSQTNPNLYGPGVAGTVSHQQMTAHIDYEYRF